MLPLYVYINPTAGSGRALQQWEIVRDKVLIPAHREWIECPQDVNSLPVSSDIMVIGGDGTFNQLVNTLFHPELYRYILLPAGTSNSLCTQISPRLSCVEKAHQYVRGARFRTMDVGELSAHGKTYRFINESSVGFAAAIAQRIEHNGYKKLFNSLHLNELSYIAVAFRCWAKEHPYMLSLCNNRRISGHLFPCPDAKIDDGQIDYYELRCPRWRLPFELSRLISRTKPVQSLFVNSGRFTKQTFHFEESMPVEIDGNPIDLASEVSISVYSHPITIL